MIGYSSAAKAVRAGRAKFFGSPDRDLPVRTDQTVHGDDLVPQFGFVGARFSERRVLLLGIHPGEGPADRSLGDERMMPSHHRFAEDPSEENFAAARIAYMRECPQWPIWTKHCVEFVGPGKLAFDEIAYTNCVPWRTPNDWKLTSGIAETADRYYLSDYMAEIEPALIIALAKTTKAVIARLRCSLPKVIYWNMSSYITPQIRPKRQSARQDFIEWLDRHPGTVGVR